ncbi:MAG: 4Fe-4S dicluster domain-containing protein [Betaproteobacteria bacterium]|nr:4Fe-4S dicluster domain-containing protein [Betaproteobacteria bacterium]
MEAILDKKNLNDWIAALDGWDAYAPALEDGVWSYRPASANAALAHPNTVQPPKGFAFPQREIFFRFEQIKGEAPRLTPVQPEPGRRVVFGVRPCDGRAVPRMDRVFADHVDDGYYRARRKDLAYVGLACHKPQSRHCFCKSVGGSPVSTEGLDVLLTDLGERYFALAVTDVGKALMQAGGALFAKAGASERKAVEQAHAAAVAQPQRGVADAAAAPAALKAGFDSPLWEELAQGCIGCGICTFLCPTCHCFDINDEVTGAAPLKGQRVRTWDTCQFPDFTMHSSGHNPRDTLGSRLRQRVSHKFRYFHENFGMLQCTGCGRCVSQCPVGIDIVQVVNRVAGSI